jgi:hypothetical protein
VSEQHSRPPISLYERYADALIREGRVDEAEKICRAILKVTPRVYALRKLIDISITNNSRNALLNYLGELIKLAPAIKKHRWVFEIIERINNETNNHSPMESPRSIAAPRVAIITAIWGRPRLTRIFFQHLFRVIHGLRIRATVKVFAAYSTPRELDNYADCAADVSFVYADNSPLSLKWQRPLDEAKAWNADIVITLGSDDFLSQVTMASLIRLISTGQALVAGFRGLYVAENADVSHWSGYNFHDQPHRTGEPQGAGRAYAGILLDSLDWKLWANAEISKGLDQCATKRIEQRGFIFSPYAPELGVIFPREKSIHYVDVGDQYAGVLDVKTSNNVTKTGGLSKGSFRKLEGCLKDTLHRLLTNEKSVDELTGYLHCDRE